MQKDCLHEVKPHVLMHGHAKESMYTMVVAGFLLASNAAWLGNFESGSGWDPGSIPRPHEVRHGFLVLNGLMS